MSREYRYPFTGRGFPQSTSKQFALAASPTSKTFLELHFIIVSHDRCSIPRNETFFSKNLSRFSGAWLKVMERSGTFVVIRKLLSIGASTILVMKICIQKRGMKVNT